VSRAGLLGAMLLVVVLIYVVAQSFLLETASCDVCIEYHGQRQCRTVGGETIEEARRGAITNACAFVSSGVTDSMACQRTAPVSESCR
jgi:hypothetical protein